MGGLTQEQPKCRTLFQGRSLLEWQKRALTGANINDIGVVRGYLKHTFTEPYQYFDNDDWQNTNMVMSLCAADEWLSNYPCVVSYSDIVYSASAVNKLLNVNADIAITYDPNWLKLWELRFDDPLEDAESFDMDIDGLLVDIGRKVKSVDEINGQYMGLIKITPSGWKSIRDYIEPMHKSAKNELDMTGLFQGLLRTQCQISATAIAGNWCEIDSESDLKACESIKID
jgi:choline kinase